MVVNIGRQTQRGVTQLCVRYKYRTLVTQLSVIWFYRVCAQPVLGLYQSCTAKKVSEWTLKCDCTSCWRRVLQMHLSQLLLLLPLGHAVPRRASAVGFITHAGIVVCASKCIIMMIIAIFKYNSNTVGALLQFNAIKHNMCSTLVQLDSITHSH